MAAVLAGEGPAGAERLVKHSIFLTDAFTGQSAAVTFWETPGPPDTIDGFNNDDSYRRSRHLINNRVSSDLVNQDNLRENSLARQLQSKEDQPAIIRLIRRRKKEELAAKDPTEPSVPWINLIPPNTKFFLEQVQENREEKVQVIDTFGEWIAFFFGRKPEVYSYAGTLLNSKNHDWKNEFQQNYDYFLRGSQAVKNRATVIMQYDDVIVEGYILNCSIQQTGIANHSVPFQFNMLVINRSPLDPRSMLGMRFARSGGSLLEAELFNDLQTTLDLTATGKIDDLETFLLVREYFSGWYVPGAGTSVHRINTNNFQAGVSVTPGQIGGISNDRPTSASFNDTTTQSIESAGISTESITG